MIEKEYALKLKDYIDNYAIPNKIMVFFRYKDLDEELAQCDYRTLQAECEKLGFHIYNFKECPPEKVDVTKERCSKLKSYAIFSDYMLTLKSKWKRHWKLIDKK